MIIFLSLNLAKVNKLKNEIITLKNQNEELKEINNNLVDLEDTKSGNTFDEDIEWFVEQVYGMSDRLELYEAISPSITEDVTVQLFGENHPPEETSKEEKSLERTVESTKIFGKFDGENEYVALATFDLVFEYRGKTDRNFTIVEVKLHKNSEGKWLINEIEEYASK